MEDPDLVERLVDERIPLTVCPLSNVRLRAHLGAGNRRELCAVSLGRNPSVLQTVRIQGHSSLIEEQRRLLKESVLQIWKARKAAVRDEIASAERAAKAIQEKLDRLDEAFLFERSIDIDTYDRHAEKLREELTLARIDRHSGQLEELDVEGILAFAERVLPRAADLWVQASLEQRQRFQQLFFPDGIAFDGNRLCWNRRNRTGLQLLAGDRGRNESLVDQTGIEPVTS